MYVPRLILNLRKNQTTINMAFLNQLLDENLQKKMNSSLVSNFRTSQLFALIHLANGGIVEIEMIFAVN
jgi:hypothetical protein